MSSVFVLGCSNGVVGVLRVVVLVLNLASVVYCSVGLAICNRYMSCVPVALNIAWVCVRGVMCVYRFFQH